MPGSHEYDKFLPKVCRFGRSIYYFILFLVSRSESAVPGWPFFLWRMRPSTIFRKLKVCGKPMLSVSRSGLRLPHAAGLSLTSAASLQSPC